MNRSVRKIERLIGIEVDSSPILHARSNINRLPLCGGRSQNVILNENAVRAVTCIRCLRSLMAAGRVTWQYHERMAEKGPYYKDVVARNKLFSIRRESK